ncbi:MAG: hypothetical protein LBC70_04370 [Chitinispirillales bacterium]|nr:hypothetical protein [Chitinispirillales bacterium]
MSTIIQSQICLASLPVNAGSTENRRVIGSWDLKDMRGSAVFLRERIWFAEQLLGLDETARNRPYRRIIGQVFVKY